MLKTLNSLIFLIIPFAVYSQTSLYNGKNPYNKNLKTGDLLKVRVENNFLANISGDYSRNLEMKLKLMPDNKNLPFLKNSEESRGNTRKEKERQIVVEKLKFVIPVQILVQPNGQIQINGNSTITTNGKLTQVLIAGIITPKSVSEGYINSSDIIGLNLQINSMPALNKDRTFKIPENADGSGGLNNFSDNDMKKYIEQYLQEVLGGLQ